MLADWCTQVRIELKPESASFIKDWMPGSGCERYVCSANVTAVKPSGATKKRC